MKTLARIAFGAVFAASATISMSGANASCNIEFTPIRVDSNGTNTIIFGRKVSVDAFYYRGFTTNPTIANLLIAATAQGNELLLRGDAASCPTAGTDRYIGLITLATMAP